MHNLINHADENKNLVVAFCNAHFKEIGANWCRHMDKLKIKNYIVFCLDQECFFYLHERGYNTFFLDYENAWSEWKERASTWAWRTQTILDLLEYQINVIHSDLDAVWQKDARELVSEDHHITSSSGTMPVRTRHKLGFTLCMGWIAFKSCKQTINMFKKIINKFPDSRFDDQVEFSKYLHEDITLNPYSITFPNEISYPDLFLTDGDLKLKVLSPDKIWRGGYTPNQWKKELYVWHPVIPGADYIKRTENARTMLKEKNLWIDAD